MDKIINYQTFKIAVSENGKNWRTYNYDFLNLEDVKNGIKYLNQSIFTKDLKKKIITINH